MYFASTYGHDALQWCSQLRAQHRHQSVRLAYHNRSLLHRSTFPQRCYSEVRVMCPIEQPDYFREKHIIRMRDRTRRH